MLSLTWGRQLEVDETQGWNLPHFGYMASNQVSGFVRFVIQQSFDRQYAREYARIGFLVNPVFQNYTLEELGLRRLNTGV